MKKTYQYPTTMVVSIRTIQMIATSPAGFNNSLDGNGKAGSSALGRRGHGSWEDDEEE